MLRVFNYSSSAHIYTTVRIFKVLFFQLGRKLETNLRIVYLLKSRLVTRVSEQAVRLCGSV